MSMDEQLLAEITAGQGEPLTKAARRFPSARQDRPVTLSCLVRWITHGMKGPNGQRIRLEAARLAGRWITTPGAIGRFIEGQTPRADDVPAPAPRTPKARRRASERAAEALQRAGI